MSCASTFFSRQQPSYSKAPPGVKHLRSFLIGRVAAPVKSEQQGHRAAVTTQVRLSSPPAGAEPSASPMTGVLFVWRGACQRSNQRWAWEAGSRVFFRCPLRTSTACPVPGSACPLEPGAISNNERIPSTPPCAWRWRANSLTRRCRICHGWLHKLMPGRSVSCHLPTPSGGGRLH